MKYYIKINQKGLIHFYDEKMQQLDFWNIEIELSEIFFNDL